MKPIVSPLHLLGALCLATGFGAPPAHAELSPYDISQPALGTEVGPGYGRRDLQFHLDLGMYFGSEKGAGSTSDGGTITEDRVVLSPMLRIVQPVGFNEVELDWGFVWLDVDSDLGSTSVFQLGNIYAAHYWVWRTLDRQIRLGVGVGAPTAVLRDETLDQTAADIATLLVGAGIRAQKDFWLWAPETLSGVLYYDTYFRFPSGFVVGGAAALASMYGFDDSFLSEALGFSGHSMVGQVEFEVAFDTEFVRSALQASYMTYVVRDLGDVDDERDFNDQIGLSAAFRIRLEKVDLVLRFDAPIDEPAGFAFDDGKLWGAHIGVSTPTDLILPER